MFDIFMIFYCCVLCPYIIWKVLNCTRFLHSLTKVLTF